MEITNQNSFSGALGCCILAFLFFMLLTSGISFFFHIPPNYIIPPLSLILAIGFTYIFSGRGKLLLPTILSSVFFIFFFAILCSLIYDSTYDSYGYHYDAVIMMAKGWDPVYETPWNECLWNQHYAKGLEIMQSAIFGLTGNLQSTKCVNFLFVISAISLTWYALGIVFPSLSRWWKAAIVFITTANPIVICQLTTAYNDYMLWIETVLLICCFLMIWETSRKV
ncbi:MAG: hypothetical protein K2K92_04295, partial [Duncaniella sp.]|nr:hypothetical protein [Duncaniella sp.]